MEVNFDGITYPKGASVLQQLVATVGRDAFLAGLGRYFRRHAWGNATLADLLAALTEESGIELGDWSAQWLETAGVNTLRPEWTVGVDGRIDSFAVLQSAPADHPTLRTHRMRIGLYDCTDAGLRRRDRVDVTVTGPRTEVPALVGQVPADLILLNDEDETYAKIRLDPTSLRTAMSAIAEFDDPLPQAICWTLAWDMTPGRAAAPREYVELVLRGIEAVRVAGVAQTQLLQLRRALESYTDPGWRETGRPETAAALLALAGGADPGGERQLAYVRAFAALASTDDQLDLLAGLLDGADGDVRGLAGGAGVPGLAVDGELRWLLLRRLVITGRRGDEAIEAELRRIRVRPASAMPPPAGPLCRCRPARLPPGSG